MKPQWAGYYDQQQTYAPGDMVVAAGRVYMARNLALKGHSLPSQQDWANIGVQENCKVDHYYFPEAIQFPLPGGEMSDETYVCADCWKNGNYAASFMGGEHAYMINELP